MKPVRSEGNRRGDRIEIMQRHKVSQNWLCDLCKLLLKVIYNWQKYMSVITMYFGA